MQQVQNHIKNKIEEANKFQNNVINIRYKIGYLYKN